jgi:hypothetical protein
MFPVMPDLVHLPALFLWLAGGLLFALGCRETVAISRVLAALRWLSVKAWLQDCYVTR